MIIQTKTFGSLEINEEKIISFKDGIPGFEALKRFFIVILDQTKPFFWLQGVDEDISLPVISPFDILADYSPLIDDTVFEELGLVREEDLLVLAVAVIPPDVTRMTANLAAPILINIAANTGRQALIESGDYLVRQPIYDAIRFGDIADCACKED